MSSRLKTLLTTLILLAILGAGAFLRFSHLRWDEFTYMHPDERFLIWVTADMRPVDSVGAFFDTATSTLNPHNVGHGFFVYGTFPLFVTRYLADALFDVPPGWEEIALTGRALSALFDLGTLLLVYLTAAALYRRRRTALLAAAFYALAVLPIQLSHFYKEDTFLNFFAMLAVYCAVRLMRRAARPGAERGNLLLALGFGAALGLATASKLNAAPVALILPLALLAAYLPLSPAQRRGLEWPFLGYLALAACTSLLVFRIAQPYAFSGPGLLGLKPNKAWVDNIIEQRNQAAGDVDFPPALQWARRSHLFGWYNLTAWGLGWPLGLLAWAGFLWAAWRIWRGERRHLPLWGWAAFYFGWQSLQFNPTMRYFLPLYPLLAIFAALAGTSARRLLRRRAVGLWVQRAVVLLVLLSSAAYALAFRNVYAQGFTRAEASRWIYANVPAPLNVPIESSAGVYHQPLSLPYDFVLRPGTPLHTQFTARQSGRVRAISLGRVFDWRQTPQSIPLRLLVSLTPDGSQVLASADATFIPGSDEPLTLTLNQALPINSGEQLYLALLTPEGQPTGLQGRLDLPVFTATGEQVTVSLDAGALGQGAGFVPYTFTLDGTFQQASASLALPPLPPPQPVTLTLHISRHPDGSQPLRSLSLSDTFEQPVAADGSPYTFLLAPPLEVQAGEPLYLTLMVAGEGAALNIRGAALANEGDWDDGLPLRMDGYDGFGGIYPRDLNFNMYWDDNPDKLARFVRILDQADYIAISSSRQWATLPRLPERFPMTTLYYRHLLGCPESRSIEWCYNVAQVGDFQGDLGFDLVHVVQHDPLLGGWRINDQFAEEAFTVYDHPKVFIFRKNATYDPQRVREILGAVDFSKVMRVTPKKAAAHPMDLMLPAARLAVQRAGGTWRALFDVQSPLNRWHVLGVAVWYVLLFLLGLLAYPLVRLGLRSLPDRGYPLARLSALLLLAWGVWLPASYQVPFERPLIAIVLAVMALSGALLAWVQRAALRAEWQERRTFFLTVEIVALAAFLLVLFLRWGNPDLWHPWKGGEKPMDFSYFNAVLKSTTFPPYDPWYAGGYINYYYYGFVVVGVLVKFLGIVPAFAYNLIIPTLFMLIVLGAFSLGVNLTADERRLRSPASALGGLIAALLLAVAGNLGTVRMVWRGYQMLAAPSPTNEAIAHLGIFTRLLWGFQGMLRSLAGASLPYGIADWYWLPSRAIPPLGDVEPITEFPAFTVIYADLHAHLIALPITLLALAFALALVYAGRQGRRLPWVGLFLGALAVGALKPTNTWDWPTYLGLAVLALALSAFLQAREGAGQAAFGLGGFAPLLLFLGLVFLLYRPYDLWFGSGYNKVDWWFGPKTPLAAYFVHWGGFLFVLVSWMTYESIRWMARTPLSALAALRPYRNVIYGTLAAFGGAMLLLGMPIPGVETPPLRDAVHVAWVVIPLGVWVLALLFDPHLDVRRKVTLFLMGSALALTLLVEVIVLRGDIGRMNTVFKFYYQAWTMFALSTAAAGYWFYRDALDHWRGRGALTWQVISALLAASMLLYPLLAGAARFKDRMSGEAPHTLDGMAYMQYAEYYDQGGPYALREDYDAIRWMQQHVQGSPVIVEGNTPEYRWGTRYTIYTGLPGVVGWNWHQRQQRGGVVPADWVTNRIGEVSAFYSTDDAQAAAVFLHKYAVRYFVVGNLERAYYPPTGLEKFALYEGVLWREAYRSGDTVVYEVIP